MCNSCPRYSGIRFVSLFVGVLIHLRGATALFVLTNWAMLEPLHVERATSLAPRFFVYVRDQQQPSAQGCQQNNTLINFMFYAFLNSESFQIIKNIENGFKNHPLYSKYDVKVWKYDPHADIYALEVSLHGNSVNLFLFYPSVDGSGKIGSIALYGSNLQGHYNAMHSSKMAFGLPISSISFESGHSVYLDIYLDY